MPNARDGVRGSVLLVVALMVWDAPTSMGSAALDAGVATVRMENALESSCDPAIASACVADVDGSPTDPGSMVVNARQQIRYVGIATNLSGLPPGILPDQNVTLRGRDLALEHGVIRGAHETYRTMLPNPPLNGTAGLALGPDNLTVYYVGPAPDDPMSPPTYHGPGYTYDEEGQGWVGYEHLGPFNANVNAHTDLEWDNLPGWCTFISDVPDCSLVMVGLASLGKSSTPDVYYGFEWEDVQVATDPDLLSSGPAASERRPTMPAATLFRNATVAKAPLQRASRDTPGPSEPGPFVPTSQFVPPTAPPEMEPPGPSSRLESVTANDAERAPILLLAATATATILLALAALLYSRFSRPEQLLKNENRKAILELLGACPGLSPTEIANRLGLARNAVIHHLNMFERSDAVVILPTDGRSTMVFLRAAGLPPPRIAAVLYHPIRGRFVQVLREAPAGLSRDEFHQRLQDIPTRTRNHTLHVLVASRVVEATADTDGSPRFRLAPEFASA